jgi:undecaprenyl diphosphate synthase
MDGNGRWAKQRHLPRAAGHKAGVNATRKLVGNCAKRGIEVLTIFAFSSENWNRPEAEVSALMSLFVTTIASEVKKLHEQNIRVCFIGEREQFSEKLQQSINASEVLTQDNTGLVLNIAANYGGRWDILNACHQLLKDVQQGSMNVSDINEQLFQRYTCLHELPDPDLFIRTGGEQRISNFLIWQLAYSELYFTDALWPDFSDAELDAAIAWYCGRQRRYGKTGEQVENENNNNKKAQQLQ